MFCLLEYNLSRYKQKILSYAGHCSQDRLYDYISLEKKGGPLGKNIDNKMGNPLKDGKAVDSQAQINTIRVYATEIGKNFN